MDWDKWYHDQAYELKMRHIKVLSDYSIDDVIKIWSAYSDDYAAGWMMDEGLNDEEISSIFNYRKELL